MIMNRNLPWQYQWCNEIYREREGEFTYSHVESIAQKMIFSRTPGLSKYIAQKIRWYFSPTIAVKISHFSKCTCGRHKLFKNALSDSKKDKTFILPGGLRRQIWHPRSLKVYLSQPLEGWIYYILRIDQFFIYKLRLLQEWSMKTKHGSTLKRNRRLCWQNKGCQPACISYHAIIIISNYLYSHF